MEYYPVMKNEILIYSAMWMNLKNIMLMKETRKKRTHKVFHVYEISMKGKFIERGSRLEIPRDGRKQG